jgi:hypothetical protein
VVSTTSWLFNTEPTKNRGWNQVLVKGKQLAIYSSSCLLQDTSHVTHIVKTSWTPLCANTNNINKTEHLQIKLCPRRDVISEHFGVFRVAHLFSFLRCVFVCLSSSCVLYSQCRQCIWFVFVLCLVFPMLIVYLVCLRHVSCIPNVASVSGLSSSCVLYSQCC